MTEAQLRHLFADHPPSPEQLPKYGLLRQRGLELAELIRIVTPPGADQRAAIRLVREAVMTAHAAIATDGAG
jgi:hypothetical protein